MFVKFASLTKVFPLCWPINIYIISKPLSSQPQPAPHKHKAEVANLQYLLDWQHPISQNQIAAVYVGNASLSVLAKVRQTGSECP